MNWILRHPATFSLLMLGGGLLNGMTARNAFLGILLYALYFVGISMIVRTRFEAFSLRSAFILSLSAMVILGSIFYYLSPISLPGLFLVCLAPILIGIKKPEAEVAPLNIQPSARLVIMWGLALATLFALSTYQFAESVRSPWDIVPTTTVLFSFAVLTIFFLVHIFEGGKRPMLYLMPALLVAISVAVSVYQFGYGFDPFIHRATLAHIIEHGTIDPKPFYYIGQYALELIGVHLFGISLFVLDIWLVPLLTVILLPLALILIGGSVAKRSALILALLIPLSPFIFTTPQSLSYLFFALTIGCLAQFLRRGSWALFLVAGVAAIATACIHPLSGIPAALLVVLAGFTHYPAWWSRVLFVGGGIATAISIPAVFFVQSAWQNLPISLGFRAYDASGLLPDFTNHFSGWLDGLYAYARFSLPLLIALALLGLIISMRAREYSLARWSAVGASALLINYLLLTLLFDFSFLIESERANYANRLPYLALLAALPLMAQGIHSIISHVRARPLAIPVLVFAVTLLATGNVYASYPRNDGETRSAGFNVGTLDYQAAQSINALFPMGSYAVLANQSLSAAALQAYGFSHYFEGDIFYYPIPTGGALYDLYLKMANEKPGRSTAEEAAQLTGASHIVFVSHNYWSGANSAREAAKVHADQWYSIGEHQEIMIFIYDFSATE